MGATDFYLGATTSYTFLCVGYSKLHTFLLELYWELHAVVWGYMEKRIFRPLKELQGTAHFL